MEIKYGKEPLDTKLCALRMLKRWWVLPLCILCGAALFAGTYYVTQILLGPARTYVAESEYYVEYKDAITYEQQYTYYNQDTWQTLGHTDLFVDTISHVIEKQGFSLSDEEICSALTTTLLTDVRIVHATVSSEDCNAAKAISDALPQAFAAFGEKQLEIDEIRPITLADQPVLKALDDRTASAAGLGAVVAFFVTLFVMYISVIVDSSLYIPLEITRRFGLPSEAGSPTSDSEDSVFYNEEEKIIYVKAGDKNSPLLERTVYDLKSQGKEISKAVLFDIDEKLNKAYFMTVSGKKKNEG